MPVPGGTSILDVHLGAHISEYAEGTRPFALRQRASFDRTAAGLAWWRRGYAADCKSVYSGSNPDQASTCFTEAPASGSPGIDCIGCSIVNADYGVDRASRS